MPEGIAQMLLILVHTLGKVEYGMGFIIAGFLLSRSLAACHALCFKLVDLLCRQAQRHTKASQSGTSLSFSDRPFAYCFDHTNNKCSECLSAVVF